MAAVAVLSQNLTDMLYMEKHEVSKRLFAIIPWEEVLKSGVFLEPKDVSLIVTLFHCPTSFKLLILTSQFIHVHCGLDCVLFS